MDLSINFCSSETLRIMENQEIMHLCPRVTILQIWSVTFLEMNNIGSPSPSLTISSPLDPSIPQPSTTNTMLWLRSVTTKPPPFTTIGLLLIISIVGVPEQNILLTTGMLSSIFLDAGHKLERERLLVSEPLFLFVYLASTKFCGQQASTYIGAMDDCFKQDSLPSREATRRVQ